MVQWRLDDRDNLKIYGIDIVHSWLDLFFLNQVLHAEKFDKIVELGTHNGALSLFFAINSNAEVHTFELKDISIARLVEKFVVSWRRNVFDLGTIDFIRSLVRDGRVLLYCDDGDKAREFNIYAPLLKSRDVIMAHDKDDEIKRGDISAIVNTCKYEPFYQDEADKIGARIFSFRRV